jgi:hypothetical protein
MRPSQGGSTSIQRTGRERVLNADSGPLSSGVALGDLLSAQVLDVQSRLDVDGFVFLPLTLRERSQNTGDSQRNAAARSQFSLDRYEKCERPRKGGGVGLDLAPR